MKEKLAEELRANRCEITRRHALQIAVKGGAVLVCTLAADSGGGEAPLWQRAGTVSDFKVGVPKKVTLKGGQVAYVLLQRNNRWLALSAICTHKGGVVQWQPGKNRFFCPLHAAAFGVAGKVIAGPARLPLPAYPTKTSANRLLVDTYGTASAGQQGQPREGKRKEKREHDRDPKRERDDDHDGDKRRKDHDDD